MKNALETSTVGVGVGRLADERGQAGNMRIVVGAESLVTDVHVGETSVHLVAALVETAADVLSVSLCGRHRLLAVGCKSRLEGRCQAVSYLFLLGLEPLPVLLLVARDAPV